MKILWVPTGVIGIGLIISGYGLIHTIDAFYPNSQGLDEAARKAAAGVTIVFGLVVIGFGVLLLGVMMGYRKIRKPSP